MTGDEMERAIEFLLKSQANFEARQATFDTRFEAERAETNRQIRDLATAQERTQEQLERTQEQLDQLSNQVAHLSSVVSELADGQRRSRDDIDVLVKLVGGLIERGNGKGAKDA
jgi:ferritin-like metal-binding protein YciE